MPLRVLLGFANAADHTLEETATAVSLGLYATANNHIYTTPPVPLATLTTALANFSAALGKQDSAGKQGTAAKNQARLELIALLRQLAGYVQSTIQDSKGEYGLSELLLSGFEAVSSPGARHPLDRPVILEIENSGAGQLTLRVRPVKNARMYEVQKKREDGPSPGAWESAGVYGSTRGMIVIGLVPGGLYAFQVRAMGGTTGQSDWSDLVSHRSL